jgi:hypothetical protein
MKFCQYLFLLTIALFSCSILAKAQSKTIPVKASSLPSGKVLITYDLIGEKPNQMYTIKVYCSYNKYLTPLRKVTGDVGANIAVGTGKEIEWDPAEELGNYKGDIDFRVVGELMAMPIAFITPIEGGSVRRGKKTMVQWEGGMPDQDVQLELFQNGQRVQSLTGSKNTGSYNWQLPSDMKKGSYTLNLIAGRETVQSGVFTVKSKVPLGVKLLPILLVGGVAAALGGGGGGDKGGTTVTATDLPVAPGPK